MDDRFQMFRSSVSGGRPPARFAGVRTWFADQQRSTEIVDGGSKSLELDDPIDGVIVAIRNAPGQVQPFAFDNGFIPYIREEEP